MHIHTMTEGQTLGEVAEIYGVSEESLLTNNSLDGYNTAVGEQLLVLTPTRTYTVRRGDTPEKLLLRFSITRRELFAQNPALYSRGLVEGEEIVIKYGEPIYGMGVANGYFYKGCPISALRRALPYLTYVTVASAIERGGEILRLFDDREAVSEALGNEKIPLLRVFRENRSEPMEKEYVCALCTAIIDAARRGGYRGVVLPESECEGYDEFLVELRGRMIGCDLILITEMSEYSDRSCNEYSDGSILSYDKYAEETPQSMSEGEERVYSDFACTAESSKTFISLPSMAKWGRGYCSINDALKAARQYGCRIETDKDTLISSFTSQRRGELRFSSLENIKAVLDLAAEYGYMGISFDIMRVPTAHLMMYNDLFRTAHYTSARAAEGCSRARGASQPEM